MHNAPSEDVAEGAKSPSLPPRKKTRWYQGVMWTGVHFVPWMKVLAKNRFRVSPSRIPMALVLTGWSLFNVLLRWIQEFWWGRAISEHELADPPVFIVGFWRSGTTMLHELLALDPRHTYPTTFQACCPNHCVLSEEFARDWLKFMLPNTRPMDNMDMGWERPQEDEIALANLGAPSHYWSVAFPNEPEQYPRYLDLEDLTPAELARWQAIFLRFLKSITFEHPGRLILKSPHHSYRVAALRRMFPEATFIRIVRNPFRVFPSAVYFLKTMFREYGLQRSRDEGLEEWILELFDRMDRQLTETLEDIPDSHSYVLRYEDLVANPVAELRDLYQHFGWEFNEETESRVREYCDARSGYRTNRYDLDEKWRSEIASRWDDYIARYGYAGDVDANSHPEKLDASRG